jgi:hypothetical protein
MGLQQVSVINHHDKPLKDKHLGIIYEFNPNDRVLVPISAAVHFFGLGLKDKSIAWKRYGFTDTERGNAYLKKFEVEVVEMVPEGDEVKAIKEEHEKTVTELTAEYEGKISILEEDHRQEVKRLQDRIAELEKPGKTAKK